MITPINPGDYLKHLHKINAKMEEMGVKIRLKVDRKNISVCYSIEVLGEVERTRSGAYVDERWWVHCIMKGVVSAQALFDEMQYRVTSQGVEDAVLKTPEWLVFFRHPICFAISLSEGILFERPEELDAIAYTPALPA